MHNEYAELDIAAEYSRATARPVRVPAEWPVPVALSGDVRSRSVRVALMRDMSTSIRGGRDARSAAAAAMPALDRASRRAVDARLRDDAVAARPRRGRAALGGRDAAHHGRPRHRRHPARPGRRRLRSGCSLVAVPAAIVIARRGLEPAGAALGRLAAVRLLARAVRPGRGHRRRRACPTSRRWRAPPPLRSWCCAMAYAAMTPGFPFAAAMPWPAPRSAPRRPLAAHPGRRPSRTI